MYQITQYIKFLLRSTNQHGVHSPFVYNLVTKCFYDRTSYDDYARISDFKRELLKNKSYIKVSDLGAGSQVMKTEKRRVSSIAKHAGSTVKRAKLIYRLVNYFNSKIILELGTSLGIGTHAMSMANPKAKITTIEGCPNISKFSSALFEANGLSNIELISGDFNAYTKKLSNNRYDLVFFDGNHQKEATLSYFEDLIKTSHNDSIFIFDDIHWSKGMTEAWKIIKEHPEVSVTIDTFYWGIVFFRTEQAKEHFTIRI